MKQSCYNVEELILHLDYNVTVSHTDNISPGVFLLFNAMNFLLNVLLFKHYISDIFCRVETNNSDRINIEYLEEKWKQVGF